ncbi:endonuclease/exonuclease/phosphatase family protein [Maribacter sp. Asnod1-A12]|uniref:endonuclease/exonuclease/phosphatase family protein n=1 Tax=Maribacter sp. Asnod1-A12 TaxID=3160576 RepID=UPI003865C770
MSFIKKIILFLNVVFAFSLFLACIVPYTSSASLAFVSLTVPALVLINMLFFLFWLFNKKIHLLISLIILVYGYFTLGTFIAFNGSNKHIVDTNSITLLSYNVLGFRGGDDVWEYNGSSQVLDFISDENPDIICLQEFVQNKIKKGSLESYPFVSKRYNLENDQGGKNLAIYSKYKIINNGKLEFPETYNGGLFVDVVVEKDTIRVFNLHMESFGVRPYSIKYERSDKLFVRLRDSFAKQQRQSLIVKKFVDESPYNILIAGDFNNTQFSKSYFDIRGNLNDSFLEAGHGYGETIKFWKFPFRIDMILVDPIFEVLDHKNYSVDLSDHEPIMATIKIPSE